LTVFALWFERLATSAPVAAVNELDLLVRCVVEADHSRAVVDRCRSAARIDRARRGVGQGIPAGRVRGVALHAQDARLVLLLRDGCCHVRVLLREGIELGMVEVVETVEVEEERAGQSRRVSDDPGKAIGHFGWGQGTKIALCGAPLLGIKAFGDFELCWRCAELRRYSEEQSYLAWIEAGGPF
jgi:hypothetical protein